MNRLLSIPAAMLVAALAVSAGASAQTNPNALPVPPLGSNAASSTIFDAMLAIARATGSDRRAAQQATVSYDTAVQQYNAGDYAHAQMSALQAISATSNYPAAAATAMPAPPIPQQNYVQMPNVLGADQADAEGFVALARRSLGTCGAPGAPVAPAVMQASAVAVHALVAQKLDIAKQSAQQVIDQCAAANDAYAKQVQAQPAASPGAGMMGSYAPLPIATLGPDPALQQTPAPAALPSATPAARHGFRL